MSDRPVGDPVDQVLRRSMTNLAELAGPAPELSELHDVVQLELEGPERRLRLPVVAIAAVLALLAGALFLFTRSEDAVEQETVDDRPASSWTAFEATATDDEWTACLVGWIADRDLSLGITGDQFAASSEVSRFVVSTALAREWFDRHDASIAVLEQIGDPLGAAEVRTALDQLGQDLGRSGPDGSVDVADVINTGARHRPNRAGCPLRNAGTALHLDMVNYGDGERALAPAVRCADAVLLARSDDDLVAALVSTGPLASELDGVSRAGATRWLSDHPDCPLLR